MKIIGKYFLHRLKKALPLMLVFMSAAAIITALAVHSGVKHSEIKYMNLNIGWVSVFLSFFATLIPILEGSEFKNRRNLDTLYSFPMSRSKMALSVYLSGLFQLFCIFSSSFFAALFCLIKYAPGVFALKYMWLYYFGALFLGIIMYSVFMFLFNEANTTIDGIIFCVMWMFFIYIIVAGFIGSAIYSSYNKMYTSGVITMEEWLSKDDVCIDHGEWGMIYKPIDRFTAFIEQNMRVNSQFYNPDYKMSHAYMFIPWVIAAIASAFGYVYRFLCKGAEKAGEISNSFFGYRMFIPVISLGTILFADMELTSYIMLAIVTVILYIIYRRGFKFKLPDIINMCVVAILFPIAIM